MATVTMSTLSVGDKVKIKINNSYKNFLVVHQGNPDTKVYDSSCTGTWLMMEEIYTLMGWRTEHYSDTANSYKDSDIHSYLNGSFLNLVETNVKNAIKSVKIPYIDGPGETGVEQTLADGLSTKVFIPADKELGYVSGMGYYLDYFKNSSGSLKVAYYNGVATEWWMRKPQSSNTSKARYVDTRGNVTGWAYVDKNYGLRPFFILPSTYTHEFEEVTFNGDVTIGGAQKEVLKIYSNIGGVWKDFVKSYQNIGSVWKE